MQTLAKQVLEYATGALEGTPLVAKELLHLGRRAAVDQVLSRLVQRGTLLRAGRGIYVLPVESRFGTRAPSVVKMVEGLANQRGETIVSHGALLEDPFSGHVFVFRGRKGDRIKVLWWCGDGMCLFAKRLENGHFVWPEARSGSVHLTQAQLSMLLEGIDWRRPIRTHKPTQV